MIQLFFIILIVLQDYFISNKETHLLHPTFWKNDSTLLNFDSLERNFIKFPHDNFDYVSSLSDDFHICTSSADREEENYFRLFQLKYPLVKSETPFKCFVIEYQSTGFWEDDVFVVNRFVNYIAEFHSKLFTHSFSNLSFIVNEILTLSWKIQPDSVVLNQIINIIEKYSQNVLVKESSKNYSNYASDLMSVLIQNQFASPIIHIFENIFVEIQNRKYHNLFVAVFNLSDYIYENSLKMKVKEMVLILHKEPGKDVNYSVAFKIPLGNKTYKCFKRNIFQKTWSYKKCLSLVSIEHDHIIYRCQCYSGGFVTLHEIDIDFSNRDNVIEYREFPSLDLTDDRLRYLKEDAARYLPVIFFMISSILILSIISLAGYCYAWLAVILSGGRFFHTKETVTVIFFFIAMNLCLFGCNFIQFYKIMYNVPVSYLLCLMVGSIHINFVITPIFMQLYVFILSLSEHKNILQHILIPIFVTAAPVSTAVIVSLQKSLIGKCSREVLNLQKDIVFYYILLPCAILLGLTLLLPIITLIVTRTIRNIFGFILVLIFGIFNCCGGVLLLLCDKEDNLELFYYACYCIVSITETLYFILLVILLIFLIKSDVSVVDQHCSINMDIRLLNRFFNRQIQVVEDKGKT